MDVINFTPDEVRELEEAHQRMMQIETGEEIDLYDTKGDYSHTEISDQ